MLVECPNCHRRYEPKPNEKYCPCCGEEIKEPLKNIEPEPKEVVKEAPVPKPVVVAAKHNIGRILGLAACLIGFLSFIFMFGSAFYTGSQSVIQLSFLSKTSNGKAYVGLIICFVIYAIMFLTNIYSTYKSVKDEDSTNVKIFIGVVQVFLVLFYAFYLTFKFKTTGQTYDPYTGRYTGAGTVTYALGDGSTKLLISLGLSSLLNFVSPFFK